MQFFFFFAKNNLGSLNIYNGHPKSILSNQKEEYLVQNGLRQEFLVLSEYSKTCLKQALKNRQNKDLKDKW